MNTENNTQTHMASHNNVTPSTPAEKLTKLTSDITNILQELQNQHPNIGSPSSQPETPVYNEKISDAIRYLQQQHEEFQKILNDSTNIDHSQTNTVTNLTNNPYPSGQHQRISNVLPEYYNNAKYEEIICRPIKPLYDGSPDQLVPFLNRLDIRRQDEGWYPITFLTIQDNNYDLIRHFAKLDESVMLTEARLRWKSPTVNTDKHTVAHPTYNARVLARLLLKSVTDDFSITVINRIPQEYRNDGPLILWTICNNIHRNNIAFIETIKSKIRDSKLSQFGEDVCKYIAHVRDNLRLITSMANSASEHNDLIIHILTQLCSSPIKPFKEAMQQLHVKYLEAQLPNLTPSQLLKRADDKAQILKHAGQWNDNDTPAVMALKLALETQKSENDKLVKQLVAHVGKLINKRPYQNQQQLQPDDRNHYHPTNKRPYNNGIELHSQTQSWITIPPSNPQETKVHDRRVYSWCTKCRQGQGLWVSHHNTSSHIDGYRQTRRRLDTNRRANLTTTSYQTPDQNLSGSDVSRDTTPLNQVQQPVAQLSLLDYLDSYLPDQDNTWNDTNNSED